MIAGATLAPLSPVYQRRPGPTRLLLDLLEFEWSNGQAIYVSIAKNSPHTLSIQTNDSALSTVTRKERCTSIPILGAHFAPDRNHKTEIANKSQQMRPLRKTVWSSPLSWTKSRLTLECIT